MFSLHDMVIEIRKSLLKREKVMVAKTRSLSIVLLCSLLFTSSCIRSKDKAAKKRVSSNKKAAQALNQIRKKAQVVHNAHLADAWYPQDAQALDTQLDDYFALAQNHFYAEVDANSVRALVVPHAGHNYSGLCAATAYQSLFTTRNLYSSDLKNKNITKVIVLAPSHTHYFKGIALPTYTGYKTALGMIDVNEPAIEILKKHDHFGHLQKAHDAEHAIEVQLPFLQKSIADFTIVPLVVGNLSSHKQVKAISTALKKIMDERTLVVVSTDFTHHGNNYRYTPFSKNIMGQVRYVDSLAIQALTTKSQESFEKMLSHTGATICGQNPLRLLLYLLEEEYATTIEPRLTCYYTSAHMLNARVGTSLVNTTKLLEPIPDSKYDNAVSYAGMVFTQQPLRELKKENQLTEYEKKALVRLARDVVENEVRKTAIPEHLLWPVMSPGLQKSTGVFVTLNKPDGKLRGCIGQILSYDPIVKTTIKMAKAAATKDNRFKPVKTKELAGLKIAVSVLSAPEKVNSFEEIHLGQHGIILNKFGKEGSLKASAVFLPTVAPANRWDLRTTLEQLSIKAGIGRDGWQEGVELQIFEGIELHEEEPLHI